MINARKGSTVSTRRGPLGVKVSIQYTLPDMTFTETAGPPKLQFLLKISVSV